MTAAKRRKDSWPCRATPEDERLAFDRGNAFSDNGIHEEKWPFKKWRCLPR